MFRRWVPHLAAALALAAVAFAALPAAATGPPRTAVPRLEQQSWLGVVAGWLGAFARLAATWEESVSLQETAEAPRCDEGAAIDPNGCPVRAQEDKGAAIDPNG